MRVAAVVHQDQGRDRTDYAAGGEVNAAESAPQDAARCIPANRGDLEKVPLCPRHLTGRAQMPPCLFRQHRGLKMDVPAHLKDWVAEKQKVLDRLLVEEPENYLKERVKFQQEYEAALTREQK